MIMEEREGDEQRLLQFMISISISRGESLVLDSRSSITGNSTMWTSLIDSWRWAMGGM